MALIVKYTLDPRTVTAVLRRTVGGVFDANNITDTVNIEGTVEHTYNDAVIGQSYGFLITAYDAEGKGIDSATFNTIYLGDTGPGKNSVVTRGYFDFGVIEELSVAEFGKHPLEVRDELASTILPSLPTGSMSTTNAGWYKCLVDGKVIFIPKNFHFRVALPKLTANDIVSYGLVSKGPDGTYNFDNNPIVTIRGYKYRWRMMKHWLGDLPDVSDQIKTLDKTVDYAGRTEFDLFYALCGARREIPTPGSSSGYDLDVTGYDPNLSGTPPTTTMPIPPFIGGDIVVGISTSISVLHCPLWPNAANTTMQTKVIDGRYKWAVRNLSVDNTVGIPIVLELVE